MVTVKDVVQRGLSFSCPGCRVEGSPDTLSKMDGGIVVTLHCSNCGYSRTYFNSDETIEDANYYGHRIAFNGRGVVHCIDCEEAQRTARPKSGVPVGMCNLERFARLKHSNCHELKSKLTVNV